MKCNNCGADFEGKFCPQCGTPAAKNSESRADGQAVQSPAAAADGEKAKGETFKAKAVAFEWKILPFFGVIAAALCLIAGVIGLAALAGPAIDYGELEEGSASGYDMLKWTGFGDGYAIALLVIAALCVICGATHLITSLRERKIRAAGYICGKVPLQSFMSLLDALLLLALAIAASAAIGWINKNFFADMGDFGELGADMGGPGAAVLCPAIFGYIFFAMCAFIAVWPLVRRYVPYKGRKVLGSLHMPKGEEYWEGISEQFADDKKNIKVCKIVSKPAQWLSVLIFAASFAALAAYIIWLAIMLFAGNADELILSLAAIPLFLLVPTAVIALFYSRSGFCILSGKSPVRAVKGKRSMAVCFAVGQVICVICIALRCFSLIMALGGRSVVQFALFTVIFIILAVLNIVTAQRQKRLFKFFTSRGDFTGKKYSAYKNSALGENFVMLDKLYEMLYYRKLEVKYPNILNSLKQQ